jgi:hypothetical protein
MSGQFIAKVHLAVADLKKQLDPFPNAELLCVAVLVKVDAMHVLHDQVWLPLVAHACIEHARDVFVIEGCEDVLFVMESLDKRGTGGMRRQDLQRYPMRSAAQDPLNQIDRADAPGSQQPNQRIWAEASGRRIAIRSVRGFVQARTVQDGEDAARSCGSAQCSSSTRSRSGSGVLSTRSNKVCNSVQFSES